MRSGNFCGQDRRPRSDADALPIRPTCAVMAAPLKAGKGADWHQQQPSDAPDGAGLVSEIHGQLQSLQIKRSPLGMASAVEILQCR